MSPEPVASGSVRSAADELNQLIRAFWTAPRAHSGVPLTEEQRAEYQRLLAELRRVERGDVTAAA